MAPHRTDPSAQTPGRAHRDTDAPSLFLPENMLRESRRQRQLPPTQVPPVCVLDPDGDLVAHALADRGATLMEHWACYHSRLVTLDTGRGTRLGLVGTVVGAPYAVMVAELMFASGCRFLISLASAGQIVDAGVPPYFVVVDRAFRDEGTSAHYLPPADEVRIDPDLLARVAPALAGVGLPLLTGGSWTTDAPFRETQAAVNAARARGLLTVEMEAAGLYAFAQARQRDVLCLAYVTNRLGQPGDFDKGHAAAAFLLVDAAATAWHTCNDRTDDRSPSHGHRCRSFHVGTRRSGVEDMNPQPKPTDENVRLQARELWEREGRPLGRNEEYLARALVSVRETGNAAADARRSGATFHAR